MKIRIKKRKTYVDRCLEATFSQDRLNQAVKELRLDADTHYHTVIGRATIYEIIATALVFVVTALTFWFGTLVTRETS